MNNSTYEILVIGLIVVLVINVILGIIFLREYCKHGVRNSGTYVAGQRSPRTENRVQPTPPPHPWRNQQPPRPPGPPPGKSALTRLPIKSGGESKTKGESTLGWNREEYLIENPNFDPAYETFLLDIDEDEYMTQLKYWFERQKDPEKKGPAHRFEWLKEHKILDRYELWSNKQIIEELKMKNSRGENLDFDPERDSILDKADRALYRKQVEWWTLRTKFDLDKYLWLKTYNFTMWLKLYKKWQKAKREENANTECAICLEDLKSNEAVKCCKNCEKCCHEVCIDAWLNRGKTKCPLCRQPFNYFIPPQNRR